jgi:hypothetical protein
MWGRVVSIDLLPNLPSFIRRVCSGYALRPFFGSPEAGVFRLIALRPFFGSPEAGVFRLMR